MPAHESPKTTLPAILLAAGLSSRMHAFKPLLSLAGKPLIQHTLDALGASGVIGPILVITGHRAAELEKVLPSNVQAVFNPQFATGEMLSSIQTGVQALTGVSPPPPGFLLALADQPAVHPETVRTLVASFFQSSPHPPLVIPNYLGKKGHPMVISWALVPAIQALPAGDTLRTVVQHSLPQARMMTVNDRWILEDLDTPEQFFQAQSRLSEMR